MLKERLTMTKPVDGPQNLRFDVVSLFPDFFTSPLASGLIGKALTRRIAEVYITNPRDFTTDKHHRVDDEPYGGGVGMVMKPDPIFAAVESLPQMEQREVVLMSPQGQPMTQDLCQEFATRLDQLVIICGHYEGVDERVSHLLTREISLGDFVLTCGEIPALALINGIVRLLPGTVGKTDSLKYDSFQTPLLDYPHYTRPAIFRGWAVPEVLLSGNHQAIADWRLEQQIERTKERRPDLYEKWMGEKGSEE
jgi:tRNA (guanine37-N1)-methyltransferase